MRLLELLTQLELDSVRVVELPAEVLLDLSQSGEVLGELATVSLSRVDHALEVVEFRFILRRYLLDVGVRSPAMLRAPASFENRDEAAQGLLEILELGVEARSTSVRDREAALLRSPELGLEATDALGQASKPLAQRSLEILGRDPGGAETPVEERLGSLHEAPTATVKATQVGDRILGLAP